jgi:hypothetical protein
MIFDYGQPGDKFYIILDGIVDILVPVECKPGLELKEETKGKKMPVPHVSRKSRIFTKDTMNEKRVVMA